MNKNTEYIDQLEHELKEYREIANDALELHHMLSQVDAKFSSKTRFLSMPLYSIEKKKNSWTFVVKNDNQSWKNRGWYTEFHGSSVESAIRGFLEYIKINDIDPSELIL